MAVLVHMALSVFALVVLAVALWLTRANLRTLDRLLDRDQSRGGH